MSSLSVAGPGKVHIDNGPVQMFVLAERHGQPLAREVGKMGDKVDHLLTVLTKALSYAKTPWPELKGVPNLPSVLKRMIEAVSLTGDEDMTPMAAVAGAFADIVADCLVHRGATKVIVNNGGDIALRLMEGERARVGISSGVGERPSRFLDVTAGSGIGGIATSGLGGRSFTLGVASSAVILANQATVADAFATHIANCTGIDSPAVTRCLARTIDPNTDIPNLLVTTKVDRLDPCEVEQALCNGLSRAKQVKAEGQILGAIIFVQGQMRVWPESIALRSIGDIG